MMDFAKQYALYKKRNEDYLKLYFNDFVEECKTLTDSTKYSLFAGGKRIRPVLMYGVADLIGSEEKETIDVFASALEMIHTSSLIHDDMPAMDDDSTRRGVPTNHIVYGDGVALLAGDTLMFKAFEIAAEHVYKNNFTRGCVKALWQLGFSTGYQGMTGGQIIDMESDPNTADINRLILMNSKKTGALIDFAVKAPVYITSSEDEYEESLDIYSKNIGLAFQIKDDILDFESSVEQLGKSTSDSINNKSTYVTVLGIEEAKKKLQVCIDNACNSIKLYGSKADFLLGLAHYVKNRSN